MSKRLDGSDRGALISRESVRRIASSINQGDNRGRSHGATPFRTSFDDGAILRLGKCSANWDKGTLADVTIYDRGTPPNETTATTPEIVPDVVNKFADIEANAWVIIALVDHGEWYVIAAECGIDAGG